MRWSSPTNDLPANNWSPTWSGIGDVACNVSDLRLALTRTLPAWLVPAHFVFIDALPVDRHGKIARQLLPARSDARPELAVPYQRPNRRWKSGWPSVLPTRCTIRPIGIHDSFFDLGGDSLSATALSFEIEQKFEVRLSPELLFDNPTVATLQAHLRNHKLAATAYPIRSTGSLPPLFCIHVFNHFASGYRRLAELLDEDQPVYVLRDSPPLVSVEEFAASYLQAMQTVQPAGPYRLCGNCLSGTIAYEMARQLHAKGEAVEFLGLIDSAFPPRKVVSDVYEAKVPATSRWHHFSKSRLAKLAVKLRLPFFRSWLKLHHAIEIAEERYRPKPIAGNPVLFTIGDIDNQAGWLDLCGDRIAVVPIADSVAARHPLQTPSDGRAVRVRTRTGRSPRIYDRSGDRPGLVPVDFTVIRPGHHRGWRDTVAKGNHVQAVVARARHDQSVIVQEVRGLSNVLRTRILRIFLLIGKLPISRSVQTDFLQGREVEQPERPFQREVYLEEIVDDARGHDRLPAHQMELHLGERAFPLLRGVKDVERPVVPTAS